MATADPRSTALDPTALRACLGHFATGVTVVTTRTADGSAHGVTVNSFTSVSLDPALVLVSIDRRATSCELLADSNGFVVNVLERDQVDLAWHFAGRHDHSLHVPWTHTGGRPAIDGCIAHIACDSWAAYDGGDHVLYLGEISHIAVHGGDPLLFHLGRFCLAGNPLD